MRHLEQFFASEHKRGRRMLELYELVQHAGNVLPRLYLLLAVGSVYIESKEAPAKDILKDLVEMCRGVQHPLKGLFLRNYLSQTCKDKLPDTGSDFEGAGGTVDDAINFILVNFCEMNKLWVRMQHQGPIKEKEKRERERLELRILVGTNLVRLGQLEGLTLDVYSSKVLPAVLEQVINCKDAIAQQYLIECVTHVFPLEYHVATLPMLLKHVDWLAAGAKKQTILMCIIDRLREHSPAEDEPEDESLFATISSHVAEMGSLGPAQSLSLHLALLRLALHAYPARLGYVDRTLRAAISLLSAAAEVSPDVAALAEELAIEPLEQYKSVLSALELEHLFPLVQARTVAVAVVVVAGVAGVE